MSRTQRRAGRQRGKAVSFPESLGRPDHGCVHLDQGAFIGMVLAAIETYRCECYGILLGAEQGGVTWVQEALPYQTARRRPRSVAVNSHRRGILKRVVSELVEPGYLGEFHSHVPQPNADVCETLSHHDVEGVGNGELQILVAVRRSSSAQRWRHNRDGSVSGASGPFFVKLRAFRNMPTSTGAVRPRVAPIRCEFIERLSRSLAAS